MNYSALRVSASGKDSYWLNGKRVTPDTWARLDRLAASYGDRSCYTTKSVTAANGQIHFQHRHEVFIPDGFRVMK